MNVTKIFIFAAVCAIAFCFPKEVFASPVEEELSELRERIDALEKNAPSSEAAPDLTERIGSLEKEVDRLGYRKVPVKLFEALDGVEFGAGLTLITQATADHPQGSAKGDVSFSGDIRLSFPVEPYGGMLFRVNTGQGNGIPAYQPPTFSGPNADLEFNDQRLNIVEAWYGTTLPLTDIRDQRISLNIGKLDPTGFFDTNRFANSETDQFLANLFVNNLALEWGGDANGYGFGGRMGYRFTSIYRKGLTVTGSAGYFDRSGDFNEALKKPFLIGELDINRKSYGFEQNVRLYAWMNSKDHSRWDDPTGPPRDNVGVGISCDQDVASSVGIFLRYGYQDPRVSRFDHVVSGGVRMLGNGWRRSRDHLGFAYGVSQASKDYRNVSEAASGYLADTNEHYFELYYKFKVLGNFFITPDVQHIINPGGDYSKRNVWIVGVRQQVNF